MKRVVYGCLEQLLRFDTMQEYDAFISNMKRKGNKYKIEESAHVGNDGLVYVKLKRQYGTSNFDVYLK